MWMIISKFLCIIYWKLELTSIGERMYQIAFTEVTYLQFCGLKIIPATETGTKHKNIVQDKKLSRFEKMETKLAHLNY